MTLCCLLAIGLPYVPGGADLLPFSAELLLIAALVGVLLVPFFSPRPNLPCAIVSIGGIGLALVSLLLNGPASGEPGRFGAMLVNDPVAFFFKTLLLVFVLGVILIWFYAAARSLAAHDGPEFFTVLLGATLGMSLMASAANLLMIFLAVEFASLPSYVLAGFRKTHRLGAEASLKYVLFGAAASAVMLYGLSMFYGLFGTLSLYQTTAADGSAVLGLAQLAASGSGHSSALLAIAFAGLVVGAGFKIAAAPFHFWCPDVFEGASIEVTTFLSVASKGAGLVLLLRVVMAFAEAYEFVHAGPLPGLAVTLGVLGALTATVGNTAAYVQNNMKRLLAYSSIAHAGYMLCALSLVIAPTSTGGASHAAATTLLIYLAVYLFMNLGAFAAAAAVWRQSGSEDLAAWAGLGRRSPLLAGCMFVMLASLIGLPPVGGFTAKLYLLWALIANGGWRWAVAGAVAINTVISAFYYFRIIRVMYLETGDPAPAKPQPLGAGVALACAVVLVGMFLGFGRLAAVAASYGRLQPVGPPSAPQALVDATLAPAD